MKGLYKINDSDAYTTYGVVFRPGTYAEILRTPTPKDGYSRSWDDEDGTERELSTIYYATKTLNIPITILASSETEFYSRYHAFTQLLLTGGYFNLDVVEMNRRLKLLYRNMSDFDKLTVIKDSSDIGCDFTLQLADDFPTQFSTIPV